LPHSVETHAFARSQCITGRVFRLLLIIHKFYFSRYCWGRISPNINVATPNLVILRRLQSPSSCHISLTCVKWVALRGEKLQKSHIRFLRKKTNFQICASPTDHGGHIGKVLHLCTPFAIQKHKKLR